jgi:hypothetical protein
MIPPGATSGLDFHADDAAKRAEAALFCHESGCPLRVDCLNAAIDRREVWGVWGGRDFTGLRRGPAKCGTRSGYYAHRRRGERSCGPCLLAHSQAQRAYYLARQEALVTT